MRLIRGHNLGTFSYVDLFFCVCFFKISSCFSYKNLIGALMTRLKETSASRAGESNREALEQLTRERDAALQEVADQKQMLAEQNRQASQAARST
jgi:hypothetical protein